jgi:glycosyltransferase involved in cell wall biosynthesis
MNGGQSAPIFTVFTASYNRAHTLHRAYESLVSQTFKNFEWLIVDDGSTDCTRGTIEHWQQEAAFTIRYIYKDNGGKHTAWNKGVESARGILFLPIDSDDSCSSEALQVFYETWLSIREDQRDKFTGVTCLVQDEFGHLVGTPFAIDVIDSNSDEIARRYKVKGDKWGFHRTEIVRNFKFPEPSGVKYVPESVVWLRIAKRYQTRFINKVLLTAYRPPAERSRLSRLPVWSSPKGRAIFYLMAIDEFRELFWYDPVFYLGSAASYARTSWHAGLGFHAQWRSMTTRGAKVMWLTMLPVGIALVLGDLFFKRRLARKQPSA